MRTLWYACGKGQPKCNIEQRKSENQLNAITQVDPCDRLNKYDHISLINLLHTPISCAYLQV